MPQTLIVREGQEAIFYCVSDNHVSWYKSASNAPVGHGNLLIIPMVGKFNEKYECKSKDDSGQIFRAIGKVKVRGTFYLL